MNNKFGLNQMLEEDEALITLLGVLDPDSENILVDVLKIAAPICLVANGHDKVLEALTEQASCEILIIYESYLILIDIIV